MVDAKRKHAVIVGVSKYRDPDITSLKFASADAQSVYQFVTDPNGGGFPKGRVSVVYGPESSMKTTLALCAAKEMQRLEPDKTVAFVDVERM